MDGFITIKQAAKMLGVSVQTLRLWDRQKKLAAHRNPMNNYRLYKKVDILDLLREIELSNGSNISQERLEM